MTMTALPRIINGTINKRRQAAIVVGFQDGVDPRSSFAGWRCCTHDRANHVIHVSRWWNPALEDLCNERANRMVRCAYCSGNRVFCKGM
jgi:hypothetical protein